MNKYELTEETITYSGKTLHRIKALRDFRNVKTGDLGGWIEKEENLDQVGNAWVCGDAKVYGNADVYGDAEVYGNADVCGNAEVYGNAKVCGNAEVYGNAKVCGDKKYTQGKFIGGDDSGKITEITEQTGSDYWQHQYVIGDYKIEDKEEPKEQVEQEDRIIELDGKKYKLVEVDE